MFLLLLMTLKFWGSPCNGAGDDGNIVLFIAFSMLGFGMISLMGIIEGCWGGEPDFRCSPLEMATLCGSVSAAMFLVCWNYWGCMQIALSGSCDLSMKTAGWATLIGNNVILVCTGATTILQAFPQMMYAYADRAAGDRIEF